MKHFYQTDCCKATELVSKYEDLSKEGNSPNFAETDYLSILDHYERANNMEDALQIIDQALGQFKTSGLLHLRKAKLLLYTKKVDSALESLNRAEIFGHSNFEINLMRIRAYCYQKEFDIAKKLLVNLKIEFFHIPEKISQVYSLEALVFERTEEYCQMFDSLKEALIENPKNSEALGRMYLCVEMSGKYEESAVLHKKLIDNDPYSYMAWFNLGHAYYAIGRLDKAVEAFDYALVINDKFELAYLDCAELCHALHMWSKALPLYLRLLELIEPDEELFCRIGECYRKMGDCEKAKVYLYRALAINPKDPAIYYHIGECYAMEGIWESSMHFYKQAVKLHPERDDYIAALAKNHVELGYPHRAIPLYKKATILLPEISDYWVALTRIFIQRNKINTAQKLLDEAFENTYDARLIYCQAACQFINNDKIKAMDTLREGLLDDHELHHLLFDICPELKEDRAVKAIINYYLTEPAEQ